MLHIHVRRIKEFDSVAKPNKEKKEAATLGELKIFHENFMDTPLFRCFTLENGGPSTATPNQDKRILPGEYTLHTRRTGVTLPQEANKIGIWLHDPKSPSFANRFIMIHIGNYPQDTEGCLLLGYGENRNGTIASSSRAVGDFYDFVKENGGVGNFILTIFEIGE